MQQDDNVGILFQRIVQTNTIGDRIVCARSIENMLISNAGDPHDGVPVRVASRQLMDRSIFDPRLPRVTCGSRLPSSVLELDVHHLFGGQSVADLRPYFRRAVRFGLRTGP